MKKDVVRVYRVVSEDVYNNLSMRGLCEKVFDSHELYMKYAIKTEITKDLADVLKKKDKRFERYILQENKKMYFFSCEGIRGTVKDEKIFKDFKVDVDMEDYPFSVLGDNCNSILSAMLWAPVNYAPFPNKYFVIVKGDLALSSLLPIGEDGNIIFKEMPLIKKVSLPDKKIDELYVYSALREGEHKLEVTRQMFLPPDRKHLLYMDRLEGLPKELENVDLSALCLSNQMYLALALCGGDYPFHVSSSNFLYNFEKKYLQFFYHLHFHVDYGERKAKSFVKTVEKKLSPFFSEVTSTVEDSSFLDGRIAKVGVTTKKYFID